MKTKIDWPNHIFNFIAVILGVYLAFYVSERAKLNDDKKESIDLMNSLINDLSEDIRIYEEYQIPTNTQHQEYVLTLLELLVAQRLDELGEPLSLVMQVENFSPTTSTYSSMKSSGKLGLIHNLKLRKSLTDYYEGVVPESIKKGEFQADYFTNELLSWMTNNVDLMDMQIRNKEEITVLSNQLIIYSSLIDQKVSSYKTIVEDSKKLKTHIERILSSP